MLLDGIARSFDTASRQGRWEVAWSGDRTISSAGGVIELAPMRATWRDQRGGITLRSHSVFTAGFEHWGLTHLWLDAGQVLLARRARGSDQTPAFDLVPATALFGRPQARLDGSNWAKELRDRSPIALRRIADRDLITAHELVDAHGTVLVRDERRFLRSSQAGGRWAFDHWTIELVANPLPDLWMAGLLLATSLGTLGRPS